jgi:hypothetical protein
MFDARIPGDTERVVAICERHGVPFSFPVATLLERARVVGALDAFALREGWSRVPSPEMHKGKWTFIGLGVDVALCETPDAARAAAAKAIEAGEV